MIIIIFINQRIIIIELFIMNNYRIINNNNFNYLKKE